MNNIINNKINNATYLIKLFPKCFSLITHFQFISNITYILIFREALIAFNLLLSSLTNTSTLLLVTTDRYSKFFNN